MGKVCDKKRETECNLSFSGIEVKIDSLVLTGFERICGTLSRWTALRNFMKDSYLSPTKNVTYVEDKD